MNWRKTTIAAVIATGTVLGGVYVVQSADILPHNNYHQNADYKGWGHDNDRKGGWSKRGPGGSAMFKGIERMCNTDITKNVDYMLERVESYLALTEEQKPAWNEFSTAIQQAKGQVSEFCGEMSKTTASAAETMTPADRLTQVQMMLKTGTGIIDTMRPSVDELYTQLDDQQKQKVDRWIN